MKWWSTLVLIGVMMLCCTSLGAYNQEWEKYFPQLAKERPDLAEKVGLSDYLFPDDWVKVVNWDEIRKQFEGTTITMGIQGHDVAAPLMFKDEFEALSGIKVELLGIPSEEFTEKVLVELLGGRVSYDTYEYYWGDTPVLLDWLQDLGPYIKQWSYKELKYIHPVYAWIQCVRDGKIVALPFDSDQRMLHYRPAMLALAGLEGPPKDQQEYLAYCEKLKNVLPEGVYPTGFQGSSGYRASLAFMDLAAPNGVDWFGPNWEVGFDSPEALQTLELLVKLATEYAPPGVANWGYSESREAWLAGKMAMIQQWQCIGRQMLDPDLSAIANEEPAPRSALMPAGVGPKARTAYPTVNGSSVSLAKASKNKEAASLWLFFLNSRETQFVYSASGTGVETCYTDVIANPKYQQLFHPAKVWLESLDHAFTENSWIPEWSQLETIADIAIGSAIAGELSPEEALKGLTARWKRVMERGGYYRPDAPKTPSTYWPEAKEEFMKTWDQLLKELLGE